MNEYKFYDIPKPCFTLCSVSVLVLCHTEECSVE